MERARRADLVEHLLDVVVLRVGEQVAPGGGVRSASKRSDADSRDLRASKISAATSPCASCRTSRSSPAGRTQVVLVEQPAARRCRRCRCSPSTSTGPITSSRLPEGDRVDHEHAVDRPEGAELRAHRVVDRCRWSGSSATPRSAASSARPGTGGRSRYSPGTTAGHRWRGPRLAVGSNSPNSRSPSSMARTPPDNGIPAPPWISALLAASTR